MYRGLLKFAKTVKNVTNTEKIEVTDRIIHTYVHVHTPDWICWDHSETRFNKGRSNHECNNLTPDKLSCVPQNTLVIPFLESTYV